MCSLLETFCKDSTVSLDMFISMYINIVDSMHMASAGATCTK